MMIRTLLGFGLILACSLGASAQGNVPTGLQASELAGALLQRCAYLFNADALKKLGEVNRLLREAAADEKKASSDEAKAQAVANRDAALQRLFTVLENTPAVRRLELAGATDSSLPEQEVQFPGHVGALLLKVHTGDDETRCAVVDYDMAAGRPSVELSVNGLTWVLVAFAHVPVSTSHIRLTLLRPKLPPVQLPVKIQTPKPGRLRVAVLSADKGNPVPAMVRLHWKTDGQDYPPSNAVELAPEFEGQGNPYDRRPALLHGALRGDYWCVPGPFDMLLQPGEWEIAIRRGFEHAPVFDIVAITADETVERRYTPRRWVDMRRRGWYSGDDHVHFRMVSDDDAERLMNWVRAEDVHLANVVKMGDIDRTYFEQRGFGKAFRYVRNDFVLSPGQECPRTHAQLGHTLAMNTTSMVRDTDKYFLYDWVFDQVHAQGGLTGYAHVHDDFFTVHRDMSMNIPKGKLDFVEVMQFGKLGTELTYEFLNLGFKMTLSAGSDVPWAGTVGEGRVYAYTGKRRFSADRWFDAVQAGRTFVTNGPMVEFTVDKALPGDEIHPKPGRRLRVKAHAWADPESGGLRRLELVRQGSVIQQCETPDEATNELSLDMEMEPGHGFWIAARAEGRDGAQAHTTPIYVVCGPLRFWDYDAVEELIAKRLANLQEIRKLVADAQQAPDPKQSPQDRTLDQFVQQAPALIERVEAAEHIYEALKATYVSEQPVRSAAP